MKTARIFSSLAAFVAIFCDAAFAGAAENGALFAQSNLPINPGTVVLLIVILVLHAIRTAKINAKIKEIEQAANAELQAKIQTLEALFEERVRRAALQMVQQMMENAKNNRSSETGDANDETRAEDA